jgi:hypothetical protein
MDNVTTTDLLLGLGHDIFMVATWLFTAMTVFIVGLSLHRLLPRRRRDVLGDRRKERR